MLAVADADVAVIDLELTGLDPVHDRIVEIGIVRARGAEVVERWSTWVSPGRLMTPEASRITGIVDEMLVGAPTFAEVVEAVRGRLEGAIVVGHRADFDALFLDAACDRVGVERLPAPGLDTLLLARTLLSLPSHRLGALATALGAGPSKGHRALADAETTHAVLVALIALVDPDGGLDLDALGRTIAGLQAGGGSREAQLSLMRSSLEARRTVHLSYVSASESGVGMVRSEREVELWRVDPPRAQGFCRLRQEERVFRLDRVLDARPGDRSYEIPAFRPRTGG